MDMFDFLLQSGLVTGVLVIYLLFFKKNPNDYRNYRKRGWNYPLKVLCARFAVRRWKCQLPVPQLEDLPKQLREGWDSFGFRASAPDGTTLLLVIRKLCGRKPLAEIVVHVKLPDGTSYMLPLHPDTVVGSWLPSEDGWSAKGLKFHISEEKSRYRILYNGLLKRIDDGVTQHVKLNLVWSPASKPVCFPDDWSNKLAAEALALEPWRGERHMLGNRKDGSWLQWGTLQGRLEAFDPDGAISQSVYLRARGVKERSWDPKGYEGLRRSVNIVASVKNGTAIQLRCLSYKHGLTECVSGCVRFPDYTVRSITSADLVMSDFCERRDGIPKVYTINVSTDNRHLKIVLRINADGGSVFTGVPYQHEVVYRTAVVDIDCVPGTGILELGYEPTVNSKPPYRLTPAPLLKWLSPSEAGSVGYCLPFEDRASRCPAYVGGKGASLALLSSVQKDEGYRVPPGFCLTIHALDKYLEANAEVKRAILDIEAANENYEEATFKEKCRRASELFITTSLPEDVRDEILAHMKYLREKAEIENLTPDLRFAVRSSAVGEDSEELSAAGQNETILGCVTDIDVLDGVQKCWASMFAFTSAYYRRQNGQACYCGGGVVVQALVSPRAAGVMFTRHPAAGDPSRLLITANYGLGESVVSGAVEPDTIIVSRGLDDSLTLSSTLLGSKTRRVTTEGSGITMEDVSEADRGVACITKAEALRLAKIGIAQEELWGAGRDIEWAVSGNEIYLLQARPITSLDRWTDEELLHELDSAIMADDELISFGNTGEVLPRPITPMTYDMVNLILKDSMDIAIGTNGSGYDDCILLTHNRCALSLYNSVYKKIPEKIDIGIIMVEMAIHGHRVADDEILASAKNRRPPHWSDKLTSICFMLKTIIIAKWNVADSISATREMNFDTVSTEPYKILIDLKRSEEKMRRLCYNHSITSTASTGSQFVAMSVLLEGKEEFTPEHCNEISNLFSSGDVLSAEVPVGLAKLARKIETSGRAEEFRTLEPKQCMNWLKDNLPDLYLDIETFLDHHGHRAIMEFDLSTKPWALVPEDMMKVLQSLNVTDVEAKKSKSNDDIIAALKTPQKPSTRKALRWILPLCHRAVRHRESTKAHLILGIHKLRVAFLRLGHILVKNWYLPTPDLVFFFRMHELNDYILTRNPALLKKASQRQQYYPSWCKLKFSEINTGWVVPVVQRGPALEGAGVRIVATSVCGGEVVARACVVKDLAEIGQLQKGDILITHATDIGWSPYFPLLTGIVTELGGLISHGAVIAREYGLPCIVGASFATDLFKTGDMVRLSGTAGVVEKVELKKEEPEAMEH